MYLYFFLKPLGIRYGDLRGIVFRPVPDHGVYYCSKFVRRRAYGVFASAPGLHAAVVMTQRRLRTGQ